MEQIEMIESFANRHGATMKQYGSCVSMTIRDSSISISRFNLVMNGRGSYTMIYQHEASIDSCSVEMLWRAIAPSTEVDMTFGEIPGMWYNSGFKLRLFLKFKVVDGEVTAFDRKVLESGRKISEALVKLKKSYGAINRTEAQPTESREDHASAITPNLEFLDSHNERKLKGFACVAGLDKLKEKLADEVIWPLTHKDIARRYRISPPNGMLLYGPPGCGKTFFAQKLAEETGFSFKMVYPSDIGGMIIHETQGKVADLFREAKKKAPCIICFDEIDAMAPRRSTTPGTEYQNTEVNEFLVQMNNCGENGIFVIGTTNNVDLIDPAILRTGRLDYQVEVPMPDMQQRKKLFSICMDGRPAEGDLQFDELARHSEGLTSSDVAFVVNRAALKAAKAGATISYSILADVLADVCSEKLKKTKDSIMIEYNQELGRKILLS